METPNRWETPPPAPAGLAARAVGVLTSPRATFEGIAAHPRWIGILVLTTVTVAAMATILVSGEFAQREMLAQQIGAMENFGATVTDEMYAGMEDGLESAPYFSFASVLVTSPLITLILAALFHGVGYGLLGSGTSFAQAFSVVAHSGMVSVLQQLFVVPLNYARESIASPTTLGAFAPTLDDDTFAYRLLSSIDLFHIWWVMILAIGMAVLWKRRTAPIAATLYCIHGGIVLAVAVVRTTFGF